MGQGTVRFPPFLTFSTGQSWPGQNLPVCQVVAPFEPTSQKLRVQIYEGVKINFKISSVTNEENRLYAGVPCVNYLDYLVFGTLSTIFSVPWLVQ